MKRILKTTAFVAVAAFTVTPAAAEDLSQLIAGSGISRGEAATLTLNELAVLKFNRGADGDDVQAIVDRAGSGEVDVVRDAQLIAAAGLTPEKAEGMTLRELAVAKRNAGASGDERQVVVKVRGAGEAGDQLIAASGLDPAQAYGLSLSEIAAAKFNRDTRQDDRQTVAD